MVDIDDGDVACCDTIQVLEVVLPSLGDDDEYDHRMMMSFDDDTHHCWWVDDDVGILLETDDDDDGNNHCTHWYKFSEYCLDCCFDDQSPRMDQQQHGGARKKKM